MIRRLLAALALLLAIAAPAVAMQKRTSNVTDPRGAVIQGATVSVYIFGTSTLATLYSDNGVTPLGNPIAASSTDGSYTYYAANGRYTEIIAASGFTFGVGQTADLILYDPSNEAGRVTDYGCKIDGATDDAVCWQNAINAMPAGGVLFMPAKATPSLIGSALTATKAITIRCAKAPTQNENAGACVLDKNFAGGTFLTFSGTGAGNPGAGYSLDGIVLRQAFGNGGTTAGQGTALKLSCTNANQRATWFRWPNVQIEEKTGADPWTIGIDIDGSGCNGLGITNTTRDHWLGNGRIQVGASTGTPHGLRATFVGNLELSNLLINGSGGNLTLTGSSSNLTDGVALSFVQVNGTLALDWVQNVTLVGGLYGTITNTANTTGANILFPGVLTNAFVNNAAASTVVAKFNTAQGFWQLSNGLLFPNAQGIVGTTTGGTAKTILKLGASDKVNIDETGAGVATGTSSIALTEAAGYLRAGAGVALASLPASNNGTLIYCSNCDPASNPCTAAGAQTGSIAIRLNGAWKCL